MRIRSLGTLAALMPALVCLSGTARAQNYQYIRPVRSTTDSTIDSYYAQAADDRNVLTGDESAAPAPAAQGMGNCDWCNQCGNCVGDWRDNTLLSIGADGFKSLGDTTQPPGAATSFMNSAGVVGSFNTGFRLGDSRVRAQVGASYGIYDLKGRDTASPPSSEQQTFVTLGLYKRSDVCAGDRISWGGVFDQFFGHQWGLQAAEVYLTQVRGIFGYALSECNEVGVWGTAHTNNDGSVTGQPTPIRAMNQANLYWRHNYAFGGQTMAYIGGVDRADIGSWLVGVTGQAPLSNYTSLYSNVTFAFPSSKTGAVGSNELEWNISVGLTYSLGGKAVSPTVSGQQGLPLLPVANNGSFLITN